MSERACSLNILCVSDSRYKVNIKEINNKLEELGLLIHIKHAYIREAKLTPKVNTDIHYYIQHRTSQTYHTRSSPEM